MKLGGYVIGLLAGVVGIAIGSFLVALAAGSGAVLVAAVTIFGPAYFLLMFTCYLLATILAATPQQSWNVISVAVFLVLIVIIVVLPPHPAFVLGALTALLLLSVPKVLLTLIGYSAAQAASYLSGTDPELFWRGFNGGVNAAYAVIFGFFIYGNLAAIVLGPVFAPAGVVVGVVFAVALFIRNGAGIFDSTTPSTKSALSWTLFLDPTAWLVEILGGVFFLFSIALHWMNSPACKITNVAIVPDSGAITITGGLPANLNTWHTAYSLGTVILIDSTATNTSSLQLHETGHGLSLSVFGSTFHFIGWIDEVFQGLVGSGDGAGGAYAERLAESNVPINPLRGPVVLMWNSA